MVMLQSHSIMVEKCMEAQAVQATRRHALGHACRPCEVLSPEWLQWKSCLLLAHT